MTEKTVPAAIALAARDFARACAMCGYEGSVDLLVIGGDPYYMVLVDDIFTYDGNEWKPKVRKERVDG